MVQKGMFSLQLVHAQSKQPFPEHVAPDGQVYAEVEPDAEYYVQIGVSAADADAANSSSGNLPAMEKFKIMCTVDGRDLGYDQFVSPGTVSYMGGWSCHNHTSSKWALQFQSASAMNFVGSNANTATISGQQITIASSSDSDHTSTANPQPDAPRSTPQPKMGSVQIQLYQAVDTGEKRLRPDTHFNGISDGNNGETEETPTANATMHYADAKMVRSHRGSHEERMAAGKYMTVYKQGPLVETLSLNYCTALGLILVKVLPKPPLWDFHRLTHYSHGNHQEVDPRLANLQPTIMTHQTRDSDGVLVQEAQCEKFDLTFLSDSETEDDDNDKGQEKNSDNIQMTVDKDGAKNDHNNNNNSSGMDGGDEKESAKTDEDDNTLAATTSTDSETSSGLIGSLLGAARSLGVTYRKNITGKTVEEKKDDDAEEMEEEIDNSVDQQGRGDGGMDSSAASKKCAPARVSDVHETVMDLGAGHNNDNETMEEVPGAAVFN